jgi:hypothetical protein
MQRFFNHPHICQVKDIYIDNNKALIKMMDHGITLNEKIHIGMNHKQKIKACITFQKL